MKKCVFVYRDRKTGSFTTPIVDDRAKENYIETMKRAFIVEPAQSHARNKDCSLYFIGYFEDTTAKFELVDPEFIFDINELDWKGADYDIESLPTEKKEA